MPMMWKPFWWMVLIMSPVACLATASGLMMARVRCWVFMISRWSLVVGRWSDGADTAFLHCIEQGFPDQRRRLHYGDARGFERLHLLGRRAVTAGNDRTGVAHAASRRRGLAGDEGDHRLLHVLFDVLGGLLLGVAADLADHDDRVR